MELYLNPRTKLHNSRADRNTYYFEGESIYVEIVPLKPLFSVRVGKRWLNSRRFFKNICMTKAHTSVVLELEIHISCPVLLTKCSILLKDHNSRSKISNALVKISS